MPPVATSQCLHNQPSYYSPCRSCCCSKEHLNSDLTETMRRHRRRLLQLLPTAVQADQKRARGTNGDVSNQPATPTNPRSLAAAPSSHHSKTKSSISDNLPTLFSTLGTHCDNSQHRAAVVPLAAVPGKGIGHGWNGSPCAQHRQRKVGLREADINTSYSALGAHGPLSRLFFHKLLGLFQNPQ